MDLISNTSFATSSNINYFFNNNYLGLYPELFLIIVISFLIAFLVVLDYINKYQLVLSSLTAHILI